MFKDTVWGIQYGNMIFVMVLSTPHKGILDREGNIIFQNKFGMDRLFYSFYSTFLPRS